MEQPSSNLFEGYKSVGHVTGPLPFVVRHGKSPQDTRIVTIINRTFHTYTTNLTLVEVSLPHEHNISALISDEKYVYTAAGRSILEWARGSKSVNQRLDNGHQADVKLMTKMGATRIVTIDEDNVLFNWNLKDKSILNIISFDDATFKISALCHPLQYKDKCLLGSEQGRLELWNVAIEKCLYKFKGWESKVCTLTQSPIENVVAIGLDDGHVYVHNIKYDEVILKIYQEYGPVTSMSFRLDGLPYLVTASEVGHLMVWNVEKKRLSTQIRMAHAGSISKCQFIRNESLLVTSGTDNTLKIWSMDMSDGGGNLLCQRAGHSEPPSFIRFYGHKGFNLLSAGQDSTIKMFHLYSERLNRNLGTARLNPSRKHRNKSNINKLPPISCFAAETTKEKQWDNIAACHKGSCLITTWNYDKCRMGEHVITQPTFNRHEVFSSCVCITGCGNFVVIGFSNGLIFKYNLQSGIFRQYYECPKLTDHRAHEGQVSGIAVDSLDLVLVSGGLDSKLRLWNFKDTSLMFEIDLSAPIKRIDLHRENNLIALALENHNIEIMDLETRQFVRKFSSSSEILDMTFSPDSRWLIASHANHSIRTWDLNLGKLIDAFRLSSACTSLTMSSTGEFLATAHQDSLGINIWCNYTIYCPTPLRPIDDDKLPPLLDMPFVRCDDQSTEDEESDDKALPDADGLLEPTYLTADQLSEQLITLSGLPASRWKNLLNIEEIRQKQLIEEEERFEKQVKVPFFIPVKDGIRPTLDKDAVENLNQDGGDQTVVSKIQNLRLLSPLAQCLIECGQSGDYSDFMSQLKELGPSATDAEIRSLGKDTCGDTQAMLCFLDAIEGEMKRGTNYDLTSAWLALFLKAHSDLIQQDRTVRKRCSGLLEAVKFNWNKLNEEFNQIFCVLNFVRSSIL